MYDIESTVGSSYSNAIAASMAVIPATSNN